MKNQKNQEDNPWEIFIKDINKLDTNPASPPPRGGRIKVGVTTNPSNIPTPKPANGTDKNTTKKFNANEFPVEAKLDLHGYTEDKAFEKVHTFVKSSYQKSFRCILIITGKGEILSKSVPLWLKSEALNGFILKSSHPKAALGGTGALYILLRRQR